MIVIEGTQVELYTLTGKVGLMVRRLDGSEELTVAQARQLATQLVRAANEAEAREGAS